MKLSIDTKIITLSSRRRVFKTESFTVETKRVADADAFISRVAGSVFTSAVPFGSYTVAVADGKSEFGIRVGADIIFFRYKSASAEGGKDRTLSALLSADNVTAEITRTNEEPNVERLYLATEANGASFPYLNDVQRRIVATEDANMLVRGVAGSGKTNVCIEKLVYCACRNYRGSALYTTFSRGLLAETRERVELFAASIDGLVAAFEDGRVRFLDGDRAGAVASKLGVPISAESDGEIVSELKRISAYLKQKTEYLLIEDIYAQKAGAAKVADEKVFIGEYLGQGKSHAACAALEKLKGISPEIIYKEIYGMIFGRYELDAPSDMLSREEYVSARADSFSRRECEAIYALAVDYAEFMKKRGYTDNNFMSRELLKSVSAPVYSVGVIDEAQDFTQANLCLLKKLCRKLFCVGDALQMINPSYFSFAYLKRIMYGDVTGVSELKHNYRSTPAIEKIAEELGEMNKRRFGTHSFVVGGEAVPSPLPSAAVFVKDGDFARSLGRKGFENATVIVSSQAKKDKLKKELGRTEILTVAEAKGLERSVVVLADVLSDSADKWRQLRDMTLDRKTADENSVYRYYFNLFYVGVSRAKQYLFVAESVCPSLFEPLFEKCFERKSKAEALELLKAVAGSIEIDDGELVERIEGFCALGQYDNALAAADRLSSDKLRDEQLAYIFVHENYLRFGRYRDAGVEYWRRGMDERAREMFTRSGDTALFPLMDACGRGGGVLDPEIVKFYPLVEDNEVARRLIVDTLGGEKDRLAAEIKAAGERFKKINSKRRRS